MVESHLRSIEDRCPNCRLQTILSLCLRPLVSIPILSQTDHRKYLPRHLVVCAVSGQHGVADSFGYQAAAIFALFEALDLC